MCTGALVSTVPAVSLKVRVMGGIEGLQATHSSGSLVVFARQILRTEFGGVTLIQHVY